MTRFKKLAIAATTAISLAATPMTVSAAPDNEDVLRTLAGLAVLGIVAKAASDRKERRARARSQSNVDYGSIDDDPYYDRYNGGRVIRGDIDRGRHGPEERARLQAGRFARAVPVGCRYRRRDFLAYGRRCLNRNYKHARKLPQDCQWQVRTDRGIRTVYGARCLRRDGWRVAGR